MSTGITRQVLSTTEGFAHIATYYQSGLRASEYYKSHGLTECQFYRWRKRYLAAHPEQSESGKRVSLGRKHFQEVKFGKANLPALGLSGLEIRYPHGVQVVIPNVMGLDIDTVLSLIKLEVSCSV